MKSQFTLALEQILDDTNLLTRKEWALYLETTEEDIKLWVEGKERPDIKQVHKIVFAVKDSDNFDSNKKIYQLFMSTLNNSNLN